MDDIQYFRKLEYQDEAYEAICKKCGVCCGSSTEDPCVNLVKQDDGTFICSCYKNRHGLQRSTKGGMFACVNIRDVIASGAYYPDCPYCNKT